MSSGSYKKQSRSEISKSLGAGMLTVPAKLRNKGDIRFDTCSNLPVEWDMSHLSPSCSGTHYFKLSAYLSPASTGEGPYIYQN